MTDYEWEIEERTEQKEIYRPRLSETPYDLKNVQRWWTRKGIVSIFQPLKRTPLITKYHILQLPDQTSSKYHFMVTISMPVFDRRENAVSSTLETSLSKHKI